MEYDYNAEGNRVRKTLDGTVIINYLVDTNRDYAQVLEERDGDGNLLVRYVYGHDLISQTRDGITSFYHYDGLGSTRALSSSAGIVTDTYHYDAFGLLLEQTGTTENAYRYRGEQFDEELGLYYLRARYMDPAIGRFVIMDGFAGSIQDPYSLHKYLYANANPVTYSDPSGNFSIGELNVSTAIRGILDRHQQLMQFARYRMMRGAIIGAANMALERWLSGEEITAGDLMTGALMGGIFEGIPFHLLYKICKLKYLLPLVGGYGLWQEYQGIEEALENGQYKLAAYRSFQALYTVYGLIHAWKSFACFPADTVIFTKDGDLPIQQIQVGDEVYSENVETGEYGFQKVTDVLVKETRVLVHLIVDGTEIQTTPKHPFWVAGKGWIHAGDLKIDDRITLSSGNSQKIIQIHQEILTQPIIVYNLTVEGWHTYFVSQQHILVHNAKWCRPATRTKKVNGHEVFQDDNLIDPDLKDARGRTNRERMKKGLAPIDSDGDSINLHHIDQTPDGPIAEVSAAEHHENYGTWHSNTGQSPSEINRSDFNKWRGKYWRKRRHDF